MIRVGDIVHYVRDGAPDADPACLAAIVSDLYGGGTVDLTVFPPAGLLVVEAVEHSDQVADHTWHHRDSC